MAAPYTQFPSAALRHGNPFHACVSDTRLEEFRQLLQLSRIGPTTYEGLQDDRKFGISSQWLGELKKDWMEFDWRQVEAKINSFPNFHLEIQDDGMTYNIHFAALFSERQDAVPILMLHGWPGSFLEFLPILTILKEQFSPSTLPYHIIVPSLPGYAFSSPPPLHRDFRLEDAARILDQVMVDLGFGSGYVVQGGDVGSKIARVLGGVHERVKAVHLNFSIMPDPGSIASSNYNDAEKEGLERAAWFKKLGSAYAFPLALLAWIGEKFLDWTDQDPDSQEILESFPKEIAPVPQAWTATTGNLVFFRQHGRGGNFAPLEHPHVLLTDLRDFVGQVWQEAK
ncbi:Alpha/Beta hydrolase protein [Stachybotrys elegans]|uniref:Alpha/Beta hydrolase protein n=1 Tax=Stachybotrys elegans TaxID=80388 RepID=A0A8K0SF87_9HYPO|nr:Alpha/Beta hydrolase protein [Stachybotrys elegans]